MIDHRRIMLIVAAILLWAMWSGVSRAQFPDFECPEQRVCPPPPPRSVCGLEFGVRIVVMSNAPDAKTILTAACGERLDGQTIEGCVFVTAFNERDELVSATVERSYPIDECQPVPSPGVGLGLAIGVLALAWRGGCSNDS